VCVGMCYEREMCLALPVAACSSAGVLILVLLSNDLHSGFQLVWLAPLSAVLHCRAAADSYGQLVRMFALSDWFLAAPLLGSTNIGRPLDPVCMFGPIRLLVLQLCKAPPLTCN
jgi:hypothetical protein